MEGPDMIVKPINDKSCRGLALAVHPGQFVREKCLAPRGLSVLAAAKLVGVGRPAFSNFLNGNAAATPEMAARIEVAFGIPKECLLRLQSAYDAEAAKAKGAPSGATPYAVPFLGIKARDIEVWVERNIPARSRLAVLLRTLVNSTGRALNKVDFPGNDDAERPGWDGKLETTQGTPWIPEGLSGWEFGTVAEPKTKADGDFAKRVTAVPQAERERTTFVFVTPRHWPGKDAWVKAHKAKGKWLDVRAYDSSDLEQWMELSIAAQAWFAHETGKSTQGVRTLDQCWTDWANVAEPGALPSALFTPAIEASKKTLLSRLAQEPDEPIVVMADSTEEALAFLAQFFMTVDDPQLATMRDRVLVFDLPGVAKELAKGTATFVAVAHSREVERELAPLMPKLRSIVVFPRNAANVEPHVVLEPLNYDTFRAPLEASGYSRDEVTRLEQESGRSLTVLRRRVAKSPGVRTPDWASDAKTAASLVPMLWVGAWNATKSADQTVLVLMANEDAYEPIERRCQRLAQLNDAPIWSVGHFRGVSSKIDLLFAIAGSVTSDDLKRFFTLAHIVLSEDDPKLDLPEEQRWAAAIHGKSREFSGKLRRSIAETLVLLSVHGRHLFRERLAFDCELAARDLVRRLLTPLNTRLLEANDNDLTAYAEAAPEEFLDIIEADLRQPTPETYGLIRPAGTDVFGVCPRTGLLWALEGLAWSTATMPRVALILAQLSEIEINDNWMNRPINSLKAIFRSWMPQTAASPEDRLKVMKQLAKRFPAVAWKICIDQLSTGSRSGSYSHKPKWRNDGHGYGEPLPTWTPIMAFTNKVVDMVLDWKAQYTQDMVCDLVNCLPGFSPEHREKVWAIVTTWAACASDSERAVVREQIRKRLLSRRVKRHTKSDDYVALSKAAKEARSALEPANLLQKHEWLFRNHWVEESADDLADDAHDWQKREERVSALRADALREIHGALGTAGVVELADLGNAPYVVGYLYSERVLEPDNVAEAIRAALVPGDPTKTSSRRVLIAGLINGRDEESERSALLDGLASTLTEDDFVRVLLGAPFRRDTWQRVDALSDDARKTYWSAVSPDWVPDADEEAAEAVERLITAKRPRAVFHSAHYNVEKFDTELLFRLMTAIAKDSEEPEGYYRLQQHYIEEAFERIDKSSALTLDQKAGLEYLYIDALAKPHVRGGKYGIPNLVKYVDAHPELYVQAIVYTYRRKDAGTDPPEFSVPDEQGAHFASQGYKLLSGIETVPGRDEHGDLNVDNLRAWIKAVRDACEGLGRLEVAEVNIGQLLAHAPPGTDGVWPCEPVRDLLEELHSDAIMRGAHTGLFNARGVHWRGQGGAQERELADKYRAWAEALQYSHPYVSSNLLMGMVQTYEDGARREDTKASIQRRLH
jgi:addiction module HigA family antidote